MSKTDSNGLTMNGRLELIRRLLDYTRNDWAELLDCTSNLIANIEHGRQRPTSDLLESIGDHFPYLTEYIVTGSGQDILTKEDKKFIKSLENYSSEEVRAILNSKARKRY